MEYPSEVLYGYFVLYAYIVPSDMWYNKEIWIISTIANHHGVCTKLGNITCFGNWDLVREPLARELIPE